MNRARFVLTTDISQFYSSIYTHSLGWALEGKATSKRRLRGGGPRPLGYRLDKAIQRAQDGQTKGIPIGPDTSFLAAEVVLSAIDFALQQKVPRFERYGLRYYDDLEYFAATRTEAENVLLAWESELAQYELTLNADKTSILEAPSPLQPAWFSALASVPVRSSSESGATSYIVNYFDRAFELAARYPKDTVISYAIRRFRNWRFTTSTWRTFFRLVLLAVIAEPSSLQHLAYALSLARAGTFRVDSSRLQETLNELVLRHAPLSNGAEVAWSLWILAENRLQVDALAANAACPMAEDPSALILFYLREKGLVGPGADLAGIEQRAAARDAVSGGNWLLAYEAAHHGWSTGSGVRNQGQLAELLDLDVCFFSPQLRTRIPVSVRKRIAAAAQGRAPVMKAKPKRKARQRKGQTAPAVEY